MRYPFNFGNYIKEGERGAKGRGIILKKIYGGHNTLAFFFTWKTKNTYFIYKTINVNCEIIIHFYTYIYFVFLVLHKYVSIFNNKTDKLHMCIPGGIKYIL